MSVLWTSEDIAAATGGEVLAPFGATGVSIDSRTVQPGDLFVPLVAERDGHQFIGKAMAAGAAGVLSDRDVDVPAVKVNGTMEALVALGRAGRERSTAKRIAVTGSVGKTSVKDALGTMLGALGKTHVSQRSFNNHLGVPITLATCPPDAQFAVFETGMNHAGELTDLSFQVMPHVAVITTVAGAHTAHFESVEAIADAKAEIRHGLVKHGILILNSDNPYTPRIRKQAERSGGINIKTFGHEGDTVIMRATHASDGGSLMVRSRWNNRGGGDCFIEHQLSGEHWDHNLAACIAVASALGLDLQKAAKALEDVSESAGRGDVSSVTIAGKAVTLIDQSYNANPESMRAAIAAAGLRDGRLVALLGDMYELGADELALHAGLAAPLQKAGFARVLTVGECMRALRGALPREMRGDHADNAELIRPMLEDELRDGDVLLIKGSNATGLGSLARALKGNG